MIFVQQRIDYERFHFPKINSWIANLRLETVSSEIETGLHRSVSVVPGQPRIEANRSKWGRSGAADRKEEGGGGGGGREGVEWWATVSAVHLLNHTVVFEGPWRWRCAHDEINKPGHDHALLGAQCAAICLASFVYLALINFNNGAKPGPRDKVSSLSFSCQDLECCHCVIVNKWVR